jgi:hypothetical protein
MSETDNNPMMKYITCHNDKEYIVVYAFPLDAGKNFCYRSRGSFNAFFYNHKKKRFRDKNRDLRYYAEDEWSYKNSITGKWAYMQDVPVVDCTSIYDFFEKIGYDYKKGKYTYEHC